MSWLPGTTEDMSLFPVEEDDSYTSGSLVGLPDHWKASMDSTKDEGGLTPYLHLRDFDKAAAVLDVENPNVDTELIFGDINEAYTWRTSQRTPNLHTAADPTKPRTLQQKKAAVKLVFKAYKSIAVATDNAGMLKAFAEQKHDNRQVEAICWSIVEACVSYCDRGPLLAAYEPARAKSNVNLRTFAERLDAVVESLSRQKTICKHLLDAPYLNRFIDDPVGSRQRVESNRKLNKRKGGVMDLGKKALGISTKKDQPLDGESTVGSEDGACENVNDKQGNSRSVSAPSRTSEEHTLPASVYGTPPNFGNTSFRSRKVKREETPSPLVHRRRRGSGTNDDAGAPAYPVIQPGPIHRFGILENSVLAARNSSQTAHSMDMLPGPILSPGPAPYLAPYPYTTASTKGAVTALIPIDSQFTYPISHYPDTYSSNDYASVPASTTYSVSDVLTDWQVDSALKPSPDSNESDGTDGDYVPQTSRKRRRQG